MHTQERTRIYEIRLLAYTHQLQVSLINMENTNGACNDTLTKSKPQYNQSYNLSQIQREVMFLLRNSRTTPLSLFTTICL